MDEAEHLKTHRETKLVCSTFLFVSNLKENPVNFKQNIVLQIGLKLSEVSFEIFAKLDVNQRLVI